MECVACGQAVVLIEDDDFDQCVKEHKRQKLPKRI